MISFTSVPPEPDYLLDREGKGINSPAVRVFAIMNVLRDIVERQDKRTRGFAEIKYSGYSLITNHPDGGPWEYSLIPVLNLGDLVSRTIEEGMSCQRDENTSSVRIAGTVFSQACRNDQQYNLTRITYEVFSASPDGKGKVYIVTDTYLEGEIPLTEFMFAMKLV